MSGADKVFQLEIWKDRGEQPEHSYFEQPPHDLRKITDTELIETLFKRAKNFEGCRLDFKEGKY